MSEYPEHPITKVKGYLLSLGIGLVVGEVV
jgi:hypothetical protein